MSTYIIFGVLTTCVYFATYAVFKHFGVFYEINTCISWMAAVVFAFYTNKYFVFRSTDHKKTIPEMIKFFVARLSTLGIDLLLTAVLISSIGLTEWTTKIITQIVIMVLNYVFSRVFVFIKEGKRQPVRVMFDAIRQRAVRLNHAHSANIGK